MDKTVDAVQLEENARFAFIVGLFGIATRSQLTGGEVAAVVSGEEVLCSLNVTQPVFVISFGAEGNDGRTDEVFLLGGSQTHSGGPADDAGLIFGLVIFQGLEEDHQHRRPKGCQAGVVNEIEDDDESPGLGGSGEDLSSVLVVYQILNLFKAFPLYGLDGSASQNVGLFNRHLASM